MPVPNLKSEVEKAARDFPEAWADAHTGNSQTESFIKLLAARCHAIDKNVALNGKRGNPLDLSDDALNCLCDASESTGRTPEGLPCVVIDVIAGAGSSSARPAWQVFNQAPEANGAWVKPGAASPVPTPVPPPAPPHVCPPLTYPPYPPTESDVDGAGSALFADFTAAGQPPNAQMFRFAFRVAYSWLTKEVPDLPASVAKHRKEWRALLGLPPLP